MERLTAEGEQLARPGIHFAVWFLLAACASSLLLATTNLLCQEVITVPLLWVLPLFIYLFSFIFCFDHPRWYQRAVFHPLFVIALFLTCAFMRFGQDFWGRLIFLALVLFATCMICHGELVRLKPPIKYLTSFYLAVSAGGAAGGVFVALIAPRLFNSFLEFELTLAAAVVLLAVVLFLDSKSWLYSGSFLLPAILVAGAIAVAYAAGEWNPEIAKTLDSIKFYPAVLLIGVLLGMGAILFERGTRPKGRRFRFVQIVVAVFACAAFVALYYSAQRKPGLISSTRNFYGVIKVFRENNAKLLVHGQTTHGVQLDPPNDGYPLAYYGPDSGIGVIMRNHPKRAAWISNLRVGVVGLGAGTIAAYGRPGDSIRFYELDPNVLALSTGDQPTFTYLRNSRAAITNVLGDARLSLEQELASGTSNQFEVLVLDAFSGDAIPVHLLTKEAFDTYWKQLASEQGIIAVHITSRHVNLMPVLMGIAQDSHAKYIMTYRLGQGLDFASGWFIMSKSPEALSIPGLQAITVQYAYNVGPRLWTDERSDVVRLLY